MKPHIRFRGIAGWVCSSATCVCYGDTATEAYLGWLQCVGPLR